MPIELFPSERRIDILTCQRNINKEELIDLALTLDENAQRFGFETWEAIAINDKSYWVVYRNWP